MSIFLIAAYIIYYLGKKGKTKQMLLLATSCAANRQIKQTGTCGRSIADTNLRW